MQPEAEPSETAPPEDVPVPLRRLMPWWYIAGAVVTLGVLVAVESGGVAIGAFWGPAIGLVIKDRRTDAQDRQRRGLPVSRCDLVGPAWLEPVLAGLLTMFAIGLGLAIGFVFDDVSPAGLWAGLGLIVASALTTLGLVVVRRRATQKALSQL
ncbi:hypothetical protein ACPEEZ_01360 [Frigoribacterium sp. 2-23]|uniref:hypothetical protein n=1 Tax=Frigoribacterium sp. 2-23 TaxID=3415006 RepID=UPI003C6EE12A